MQAPHLFVCKLRRSLHLKRTNTKKFTNLHHGCNAQIESSQISKAQKHEIVVATSDKSYNLEMVRARDETESDRHVAHRVSAAWHVAPLAHWRTRLQIFIHRQFIIGSALEQTNVGHVLTLVSSHVKDTWHKCYLGTLYLGPQKNKKQKNSHFIKGERLPIQYLYPSRKSTFYPTNFWQVTMGRVIPIVLPLPFGYIKGCFG